MAVPVGRGFLVQPCSSSSSIFHNKIYKPSLGAASTLWSTSAPRRYGQIAVQAQQRPTWLPGLDPPPYLDGTWATSPIEKSRQLNSVIKWKLLYQFIVFPLSKFRLAGDYGFDPLGLGEDPESLKWYVQAELVHARFAMAGVAGILFTDVSGWKSSSWVPNKYHWSSYEWIGLTCTTNLWWYITTFIAVTTRYRDQ